MDATKVLAAIEETTRSAQMQGRVFAFRAAHEVCCRHYNATKNGVAFAIAQDIFKLIEAEMTAHASASAKETSQDAIS